MDVLADIELGDSRSLEPPSKNRLISETLRDAARRVRASKKVLGGGGFANRRGERLFHVVVWISALVLLVIPVGFSSIYFGFFASSQYQSEMQLLVKKSNSGPSSLGTLKNVSFSNGAQEANILQNYIFSRDMIDFLETRLKLRSMFSGSDIDRLSSFDTSQPVEEFERYWKKQVDVGVDKMSGILSVNSRAFSADDAQKINQAILERSEALVNELSERARSDAVTQSEQELKAAQNAVRAAGLDMATLRNKEGLIDPQIQAQALTELTTNLQQRLITLKSRRQALIEGGGKGSPQLDVMSREINSLADQMAKIEQQITSNAPVEDQRSLSSKIGAFEQSNLDREVAQKRYASAAISYEQAKMAMASKQIYVAEVSAPTRPESAEYPRRGWNIALSIMICAAIWGGFVGIASLIRNHLAA